MGRHISSATNKPTTMSRFREWASWFALFALLVQNIVPFSKALAIEPGVEVGYQIICTASGLKEVPIGDDGNPIIPKGAGSGYCPFCFVTSAPAYFEPAFDHVVHQPVVDTSPNIAIVRSTELPSLWRALPRPSRAPPSNV